MPFNPTSGTVGASGPLKPQEWRTPPQLQPPQTGTETGITGGSGVGSWASASYINPGYQTNIQLRYYDVQEPAGSLHVVPEEDSWVAFIPPAYAVPPAQVTYATLQPWSFDYVEVPSPIVPIVPDVDDWVSGVAPVQASYIYPQPSLWDNVEYSQMLGGSGDGSWSAATYVTPEQEVLLTTVYGSEDVPQLLTPFQPDEDFWNNSVQPLQLTYQYPQQWSFTEGTESVPSIQFQPDEDFWILAPQQQLGILPPAYEPTVFWYEEDLNLVFQPDEDYWVNQVPPVSITFTPLQPFATVDEQLVLSGQLDEDFWVNAVPPVQFTYIVPQQWAFDEQIPAGSLVGTVDEDFWRNSVAPVVATYYQTLPYGFGAERSTDFIPFTPTPPATGRSARFGFSQPSFR